TRRTPLGTRPATGRGPRHVRVRFPTTAPRHPRTAARMRRVTVTATTDLWHHYGRSRAATDRAVPRDFRWSWGQDSGPGAEVLGDLSGRIVGDLGAGAARHAAHLA